jgi:hypothetical protein
MAGANMEDIRPGRVPFVAGKDEASDYQERGILCLPAFGAVLRAFVVGCTREAL